MKQEQQWMSISDMMSGLMVIFLFISIAFIVQIQSEQNSVKQIVLAYQKYQQSLNKDLQKEFKNDLKKWGALITKDNTVRFYSPKVLFKSGSSEISDKFKKILDDFFPRYVKLIASKPYYKEVDEIRVEGHTSSIWASTKSKKEIYLRNMQLSQDRASSVLMYCYNNKNKHIKNNRRWLEDKFLSIGMAFSKLIYKKNKKQDFQKARRVDFKISTKIQYKIFSILEDAK